MKRILWISLGAALALIPAVASANIAWDGPK